MEYSSNNHESIVLEVTETCEGTDRIAPYGKQIADVLLEKKKAQGRNRKSIRDRLK